MSPTPRRRSRSTWADAAKALMHVRAEQRACRNCAHFRTPDRRDRDDSKGICRLRECEAISQGMLPGFGSAHFVAANHLCDRWQQLTPYQAEHA